MYAKIKDNKITQYPADPRMDYPQKNIALDFKSGIIDSDEYVFVEPTNAPNVEYTQKVEEKLPEFIEGKWMQTWNIIDKSKDELDMEIKNRLIGIRLSRNKRLSESDWALGNDSPLNEADKAKYIKYRQELRDLPNQKGFDPFNFTLPQLPKTAANEQPESEGAIIL